MEDKLNIISHNSENNESNLWVKFLTILLWFLFLFSKIILIILFFLYALIWYYLIKLFTNIIFPLFEEKKTSETNDLISLWLLIIVFWLLIIWYILFLASFWFYNDFVFEINKFVNLFFVLVSKSFLDFNLFVNFLNFFNASLITLFIAFLIYSINKHMLPKVKLPFISW